MTKEDPIKSIEDCDSVKNSQFYDIINNLDVKNRKSEELEELKKFILSLSEDDAVAVLVHFLDNEYKYMKDNDADNDEVEEFMSDERFNKYYEIILSTMPDHLK